MNSTNNLPLQVLPERFAVCRIAADSEIPEWARPGDLLAILRTPEELSIVCAERFVPPEIKSERGWRAIRVQGPLDFSMVGVLVSIAEPLSRINVSIFVLSSYDTDYILVKENQLENSVQALEQSGFLVIDYERLSS